MKAVLFTLNASYIHKSLSLRCLAPMLAARGWETVTVEFSVKEKRLNVLDRLYREAADVYGFSCYIWNITEMKQVAEKLKKLRPEAAIIFGGPEVSFEDEAFFESHGYVDFIVAGEGEEALPSLCEAIRERGLPSVREEGRIVSAGPYKGFAKEGVLYREEEALDSSVVYYESCRGCPFSCAYCLSAAGEGVRAKEAGQVLRELLDFEKLGNIKIVKFVDRTFNFDRRRAVAIWRGLLSEAYTKTYHFEICAELLDEEAFAVLSRFPKGKIQVEAGVQSTHPETLEAIRRSQNVRLCLDNLRRLKEAGNLEVHADLIAGLPCEDLPTFGKSFDDVYGVCDDLKLGFLKLLKGSPLHREAERYGIVCASDPPYEVLRTAALSFSDLVFLHNVETVLERFGNSGHFSYTLKAVMPTVPSPFGFFAALAEFPGMSGELSQLRAIGLFRDFCLSLGVLEEKELTGRLRLDYYIHEAGSAPAFLAGGGELAVGPTFRALAIQKAGFGREGSGVEVHSFSFDPEGLYVTDRRRHRCIRVGKEELPLT